MTDIGPHLLGRIPSPPDARDWQLERFLSTDPVDVAYAALMKANVAKATKNWATAVMPLLGHSPAPPPPPPVPSGAVEWADVEAVLDQGNYGTCVGNGWAQWGNTNPVDDKYIETDARAIYLEATGYDGAKDYTYQVGSTVRSGAKAMSARKRLTAYAFASTTDAITAWVQKNGPVVCGTDWLENMFDPDPNGFVPVSGSVAGGHCYLLHGYDPNQQAYKFLNSWGTSWGLKGHFYMRVVDFAKLLSQQGEACVALEVA